MSMYRENKKQITKLEELQQERKTLKGLRADAETNARCGFHEKWIEEEILVSKNKIKKLEEGMKL